MKTSTSQQLNKEIYLDTGHFYSFQTFQTNLWWHFPPVFCWQGLSAIVVLGEMDDAPWWKLAGYTFCILMMMAPCLRGLTGEVLMEKGFEVSANVYQITGYLWNSMDIYGYL